MKVAQMVYLLDLPFCFVTNSSICVCKSTSEGKVCIGKAMCTYSQ